jgi:hypothetical protein
MAAVTLIHRSKLLTVDPSLTTYRMKLFVGAGLIPPATKIGLREYWKLSDLHALLQKTSEQDALVKIERARRKLKKEKAAA